MNNRYNYNNSVASNNYSSNRQAAKSASAYSDSMKVMQKPLFLVAAAMLMLIFFTGTAHAITATISPSGTINIDYYNNGNILTTYVGTGPTTSVYSVLWFNAAPSTYGSCDFEQPATPSGSSLTLYFPTGGTFNDPSCTSGSTANTFTVSPDSGPYTIQFTATNSANGSDNAIVTTTVNINSALSVPTISPSNPTIDSGQSVTFSSTWSGGTGPYTANIYASTSSTCNTGSAPVQIRSSLSSGSATFTVSPTSTTYYCIGVTDSAFNSQTQYSNVVPVTVNSALVVNTPTITNTTLDQNQNSIITDSVSGGSSNFAYQWYLEAPGSSTYSLISGATTNAYAFKTTTSTTLGTYNFRLKVTDTGTSNSYYVNSTAASITVYTTPTVTLIPSDISVTAGQPAVYTASVSGGKGPFDLVLYNITGNKNTGSTNTITVSPGSAELIYVPTNPNGAIVNFNAIATDTGTTTNYVFNSTKVTLSSDPVPLISLTPSNTALDSGQYETYTITVTSGNADGPFTINFYNQTSGQKLIKSFAFTSSDPTNTVTFQTGPAGTFTYNAVATDQATGYVFTSEPSIINVHADPAVALVPSNAILDSGQTEAFGITVNNGFSPFNTELYNITGSKQQGSNITVSPSGSTGYVKFTTGPTGTFTYNAIATDQGTTTHFVSTSGPVSITVNPALQIAAPTATNAIVDINQVSVLSSTGATGGTPTYSYQWLEEAPGASTYSSISGATSNSYNFNTASLTTPGTYNFELQVTDSASTHVSITSSPVSVAVYTTPTATQLTPSNTVLDNGQSVTYTVLISNGKGTFNLNLVDTSTGFSVESMPGTSDGTVTFPSFIPPQGTNTYKVEAIDTGTTTPYQFSSSQNTIIVNSAPTQTTLTINSTKFDEGQQVVLSSTAETGGTPPYYYNFSVYDAATGAYIFGSNSISNTYSFPANVSTDLYATVNVTDSASAPETVLSSNVPFNVQITPLLFINPSNPVIDSGQTETYSLSVGGGFGPFNAELYNISGSKQQDSNVIINTLGYTSNVTVGNLATESVNLPSGYGTYICGAGSNYTFATSGQQFSWTSDISSPSSSPISISSIGRQSSDKCIASTTGAENNGMAMIGIGINEQPSNLVQVYTADPSQSGSKGTSNTDPLTPLPYTAPNSNAFTLIVVASGFDQLVSVTLPVGCTELSFVNNSDQYGSVYMAACYGQSGQKTVTANAYSDSSLSMAAYVFNSLPTGAGSVSFTANTNTHKTLTFGAIATDTGSTKPFVFTSMGDGNTITENTALLPSTISSNGIKFDTGQSISLTSTTPETGTSPYTYNFIITNTLTGSTLFYSGIPASLNTYSFAANSVMVGGDTANVIVTDSASTPVSIGSSNTINLIVSQAPTAVLTSSNTILDSGQGVTLTATTSGGFGPFTYTFYNTHTGAAIATCENLSVNTCSFTSDVTGSFTYNAVVTDTGTTNPYVFSSNNKVITVNVDPILTITPSAPTIDSGGTETFTLTVDHGTGPFTVELYEVTSLSQVGSNVIVSVPSGSNTVTFTTQSSSAGTFTFNAIGTDQGTTSPFVFNSTKSNIEISTNPSISIVPTNTALITGQYEKFNVFTVNGIGPFNIELYNITGSKQQGTNITLLQNTNGNFVPFKAGATGTFTYNAIATDTGTHPSSMFSSNSNTITVFSVPTVSVTPSAPAIDNGQSITLSSSVNGGSGNFIYQWYTGTPGGSNTLITGAESSSYTTSPTSSTSYFVVVTDQGITTQYTFNSAADSVTVNPALQSTSLQSSSTLDSGQSITFSTTTSEGTKPYSYSWNTDGLTVTSGCTSTSSTCTATAPTVSASTPYTVSLTVGDSAVGTPAQKITLTTLVTVHPAPTITISPSNTVLDSGQTEVYTATVSSGGFGSFSVELYNISESMQQGTNTVITSPGGSSTFTFTSGATDTFTYNAIATDLGTTAPYTFTSSSNRIIVNKALVSGAASFTGWIGNGCTLLPQCINSLSSRTATTMDQGEGVVASVAAPTTGTSPYSYQWLAKAPNQQSYTAAEANTLCGATAQMPSCNFLATTADTTGTYSFEAQTTDSASTNSVVTSNPVTLTLNGALVLNPVTSNALVVDEGQSFALSDILPATGGTSPFSILWDIKTAGIDNATILTSACGNIGVGYSFNSVCAISTPGSVSLDVGNPVILVPGTYSFSSRVGDSSFNQAVPTYGWYNLPLSITINPALTLSVSSSASSMHADQQVVLTNTTVDGTSPYSYQWYYKAPGATTYSMITGATSNDFTFDASTIPITTGGTYNFRLVVTDSASNPVKVNATSVPVAVNAMFATPVQLVDVVAPIINNPDSGNGFWALDTISRHITSYQTGIHSFIMNFSDTGTANTYAGLHSPGSADILEPYNGVASFTGYSNMTFNGTFTPGSNPVTGTLATFNNQGTIGNLFNNTAGSAVSTFQHYIDLYFTPTTSPSNYSLNGWGWTYTYSIYPTKSQKWIDTKAVTSGDIVTYQVPTVTMSAPSNSIVDSGQYESYSATVYNGIGPFTVGLYQTGHASPIETNTLSSAGVVDFAAFQPSPAGSYTYHVSVEDTGTTPGAVGPADYTFNSLSSTVTVNPVLVSSASATPSSIHADQQSMLSGSASGTGTSPYAYQWFMQQPSGSYFAIPGATTDAYTFNAEQLGYTVGGIYNFKLQVTDSVSSPVTINSVAVPVAVNAMFSQPQVLLNVNANVINDEDSNYSANYWGLDSFARHITANQIGLQTFVINFTDSGHTFIPAGARSPTANTIQPYDGIATMNGAQNYTFNATSFVTNNLPVATNGMFIGTLNEHGTLADIVSSLAPTGPSGAAELYYIDGYFSNPINPMSVGSPNWGGFVYSYTYNTYPLQGQTWIDAGNVPQANSGDIITYQVPTVSMSAPSNTVLDHGQTEAYSATVYNGIGPFTVKLMQTGSSTPIATTTVSASSQGNAAGAAVTFAPFTPAQGTDSYYVLAKDTGSTPGAVAPANYNFDSPTNTIQVNSAPAISLAVNSIFDSGQQATFTMNVNGGTGPFTVELYNITGSNQAGSNVIVSVPGGSNTISFTTNSPVNSNTFTYKAMATDLGTTTPYSFSSVQKTITVNTNMTKPSVTVSGRSFDVGEAVEASVTGLNGGTPPYAYSFTIMNKNTSAELFTCTNINANICTFSATQTGVFTANAEASDSASTPATVSAGSNAFNVNPNFFNSEAKVVPSITTLNIGNNIVLAGSIIGQGGTAPYSYTYNIYNYSTKALVYTSSPQVTNSMTNSLDYSPSTNGIFYATLTVMDNASPNEPIYSPDSKAFLVGPIGHPVLSLTPTSPTLDSGESEVMQLGVFGGVGPYTIALYNVTNTLNVQQIGSNVTISNSGGTNTLAFNVPSVTAASVYEYNAVATDSVTHDVFNSTKVSITVNPPLGSNVTATPNAIDLGQSSLITAKIHGGTPGYTFTFNIYNSANTLVYSYADSNVPAGNPTSANNLFTSASTNSIGNDTIHVVVSDATYNGGACAEPSCEVLNSTLTVYPTPTVSLTASNTTADVGQPETLTASIPANTGSGSFTYTFYNIGTSTNSVISGCSATAADTCTFPISGTAPYSYNVVATDSVTGYNFSSTPVTLTKVYPAPVVTLTPSNSTPLIGQKVTYTVDITGGSSNFMVQPYNVTSGNAIGTAFAYPATSTFQITSSSTAGAYAYNVVVTDSATNYVLTVSNSIKVGTHTATTSVSQGCGGCGGGGAAPGGGGSAKPTVLPYNATTVHGWKVLNFSQDNSESLKVNGRTFDITLNSISPTLVDVTVNGYAYTLNPSQPVPLTGLSNYSVELVSISYLPIEDTAVVQLYGPNQLAKSNTTSTSSGNTSTSNTKTTVKTTATTTVATTTVPPKVSTVKPTTTVSAPPASTEELGAGIIVVILLVIGGMYYYLRFNKKGKRR